ncbi:MAG: hypothetical protein NWF07_11310 [Candidatus Bathyarchaeota archaeon]|nr:hypothetical protein [Candidatus Bathyarchaeota archaeon]
MNDELISNLYREESGVVVSDMRGQWFELTEDYDHKSVFASQLVPRGTRLMFMNLTMGRYWFRFTVKMENLCGVSELGLRRGELEKLVVKPVKM